MLISARFQKVKASKGIVYKSSMVPRMHVAISLPANPKKGSKHKRIPLQK
jgi:hypothetical protein